MLNLDFPSKDNATLSQIMGHVEIKSFISHFSANLDENHGFSSPFDRNKLSLWEKYEKPMNNYLF